MKSFNRKDYVYLRVLEDYKDKEGDKYKKGEILRYRKEWLISNITGRQFGNVFDYDNELVYEKNEDCEENDFLFHKVYKSITVSKDRRYTLYLWPGDCFYLNDWLYQHIDSDGMNTITNSQKKVIADKTNKSKRIELKEGYPNKALKARIYFKKGECLDFSNPAVISLFYDLNWLKLFAKTEVITGQEKENLFKFDFSNAIYAQKPNTAYMWKENPNYDLHEYHYFKVKDGIKAQTKEELKKKWKMSLPYEVESICDEQGFIKWVYTITGCFESSSRYTEQFILQFANKMSVAEAYECHQNLIANYIQEQEEEHKKWQKEKEEEKNKLQELYEAKKEDPFYFPGVNGNFVHNDNKNEGQDKERYTLHQIKNFYQKLKTLDPEVIKEMCFYGGTIPYVLNDASESRNFGDIDIFVPVAQMEKLRKELIKQDSFEMIFDSKPLAQSCHLTSRIQKKSTELVDEIEKENEFLDLMYDAMTTPQDEGVIDLDQNGEPYNPWEEFFNRTRSYYNKIQDFGFKAKLFGINISVFPLYQYKENLMAKSFNVNETNKFLLGVRVLNNTSMDEFVKNVVVYDSAFKVLPLEYTLVSKKSAIQDQYASRLDKDREDIEYILSHKEELGIDEGKIQEILSKYPDYSISIAYRVNDDGTTTTMGGETYKELILTNRNLS